MRWVLSNSSKLLWLCNDQLFWIISILFIALYSSSAKTEEIPSKAKIYLPEVIHQTNLYLPNIHYPEYVAGLIEQETCISLKHSFCWNPKAELKTQREQGVGLGQITRAWDSSGQLRFDTLGELRRKYPNELGEMEWTTIKERPDLQIRAIVLLVNENYSRLPKEIISDYEKLALADSAYNGGYGNLNKRRTMCGLAKGCNPNTWFENVERYCPTGTKKLYGNKTACQINEEHVRNIMHWRMNRYLEHYQNHAE